jgi:hypothetical protein
VKNEAWYVMFPKARVPSENAVSEVLRSIRGATIRSEGELAFTVEVGRRSFVVAINALPHIVAETRALVEQHRAALDDPAVIETYDARLELWFDEGDMGDLFNPILAAAERLAELTGGVVYEANTGVFQ